MITPQNRDREAALSYIERYFLPSSALLGMVGMGGLFLLSTYQWQRHTLTVPAFTREMTIGLMAGLLSLLHARYQYFILENFPRHYAELSARADRMILSRPAAIVHPRRRLVVAGYVAGILLFLLAVGFLHRGVSWVGVVSFAMAGFFITRVAFWKKVVESARANGSGGGK